MFPETTPEALSSFSNVKKWASVARYAVNKILGLAGKMVMDGKETHKALYLCNSTDVTAGVALRMLTHEGARLVEWTSMFLKVMSHLYATKVGCGKIP